MNIRSIPLLLVIILLIVSSIHVNANNSDNLSSGNDLLQEVLFFSPAIIESKEDYISVDIVEANSYIQGSEKPNIPIYSKIYTFPIGTKIKKIEITPFDIKETKISKEIKLSKTLIPISPSKITNIGIKNDKSPEKENVYSSLGLYPEKWFDYTINCGLKENKNVLLLNIICNLIKYSPQENIVYQPENFDIKIFYKKPIQTLSVDNDYDMVVIAPSKFSLRLKPLIDHKNNVGMKTILKTTESIYLDALADEFERVGRDRAEKIKLFIHWAKKNWDIKYVLLVGGRNQQGVFWNVPPRYIKLDDEPYTADNWEICYLSDLYFADIYKYDDEHGYVFDDWDSNGNDIFGEWTFKYVYNESSERYELKKEKKDVLDLYPDIYIGRLPCRTKSEVTILVRKIINYETETYGSDWFKKAILVGGDTTPPVDGGENGYYEGELIVNKSGDYLETLGFNLTKLYASKNNFNGTTDFINEFHKGAGFVHMPGHGSPLDWGTHPTDVEELGQWIDGLYNSEMKFLKNSKKLPIVIVGGCHNNQFDVGFINMIKGIFRYGLKYFIWNVSRDCYHKWYWISRCFCENFIRQRDGGAIAAIGNTGLGWESIDSGCTENLGGWIEPHFFQVYANTEEQNRTLGRIHSQTISDYITAFDPNDGGSGDDYTKDRKTIDQWALFGDPSLKIGGYPPQ